MIGLIMMAYLQCRCIQPVTGLGAIGNLYRAFFIFKIQML